MQPSPYNIYIDQPEGCHIYNGATCTIVKATRRAVAALRAGRVTPSLAANKTLLDAGVITAHPSKQLAMLKSLFARAQRPTRHCMFVISPTTQCNLACPYCYEHTAIPQKATMTMATARRVAKFVCHEMAMPERTGVLLKFYGGEPLLKLDLCQYIADRVGRWCEKNKKQMVSWVQTNGALISERMPIEKLRNLGCVEITIDGDETKHNQVRMGRKGEPTYRRIIDAIHLLEKRHIYVTLRLNMHSADEVSRTLSDLDRYGVLALKGVRFYDGQVSNDFVEDKFGGECLGHVQNESLLKMMKEVRAAVRASVWRHKYQRFPLFVRSNGICSYAKPGCYSIDPRGDLYTCVFQQSRKSHRIGSIAANGVPRFTHLYEQIIHRSPFNYDKCLDCSILSQCWGGCFAQALDRHGTVDAPYCGTMQQTVPALLAASIQEEQDEAVKV